jgi:hypothetical protein
MKNKVIALAITFTIMVTPAGAALIFLDHFDGEAVDPFVWSTDIGINNPPISVHDSLVDLSAYGGSVFSGKRQAYIISTDIAIPAGMAEVDVSWTWRSAPDFNRRGFFSFDLLNINGDPSKAFLSSSRIISGQELWNWKIDAGTYGDVVRPTPVPTEFTISTLKLFANSAQYWESADGVTSNMFWELGTTHFYNLTNFQVRLGSYNTATDQAASKMSTDKVEINTIPEPSVCALIGVGLAVMWRRMRRVCG